MAYRKNGSSNHLELGSAEMDKYASVGFDSLMSEIDNPTPQINNPCNQFMRTNGDKYIIVMVGLPGRGKSYIARRISQYLSFFQRAQCEMFNVGTFRRKIYGSACGHDFFDDSISESRRKRFKCYQVTMDALKTWFQGNTHEESAKVAIYDSTNVTYQQRREVFEAFLPLVETKSHIIFIESICDDERVLGNNLSQILAMPDYSNLTDQQALEDFKKRIGHYSKRYEPIGSADDTFTWVKYVDGGRQISMNNIRGFLPGKVVQLLTNLNLEIQPIYLSRHGQSEYNVLNKIGGDSDLSSEGELYAKELAKFVHKNLLGYNEDGSFKHEDQKKAAPRARLFTSSLKRTQQTARYIVHNKCDDGWVTMRQKSWKALDEIYAGLFDGMTYEEIKLKAPGEFEHRKKDKLGYRYPRGESYLDVVQRLDAVVHEIERLRDPLLIIAHQGILRIIYSYYMGFKLEDAPLVSIPLNTVIKLSDMAHSCKEERIVLIKKNESEEPPSH